MPWEELSARFAMGTHASRAPQFSPSMSPPATFSVLTDSVSLVGMLTVSGKEAWRVGTEREDKNISAWQTILAQDRLGTICWSLCGGWALALSLARLEKSAANTLHSSGMHEGLWWSGHLQDTPG